MGARLAILAVFATLIVSGCASGPPFIEAAQPQALQTAQRRAQFEFNCRAVALEGDDDLAAAVHAFRAA